MRPGAITVGVLGKVGMLISAKKARRPDNGYCQVWDIVFLNRNGGVSSLMSSSGCYVVVPQPAQHLEPLR